MKVRLIDYNVTDNNEFEYRVNVALRYGKKNYVVSVTCWHDFNESGIPYIRCITGFRYLASVKKQSIARDLAITRFLKGMEIPSK